MGDLLFEPDGRTIWARQDKTSGGLCHRYDLERGRPVPMPAGLPAPKCLPALRDDGALFVLEPESQQEHTYRIWNLRTASPEGLPLTPPADYVPLALAPGGRVVAFVSHSGKWLDTCSVQFWNRETGEPLGAPVAQLEMVRAWAFSPDGLVFASSGRDREVRFWDVATSRPLGSSLVHEDHVMDIAFSSEGRTLFSGSWDCSARLWRLGVFSPLPPPRSTALASIEGKYPHVFRRSPFSRALFGPERRSVLLRAGADWLFDPRTIPPAEDHGLCRLVDVASAIPRGPSLGPRNRYVGSIAMSPDGSLAASCTSQNSNST
ncbi:MAG TPA: hypothetical protein VFT74_05330, partial [Isosphaeraceae bacterium]|nr:hypothetical protein [Isosphaeraceae bacterium]